MTAEPIPATRWPERRRLVALALVVSGLVVWGPKGPQAGNVSKAN